MAEVHTVMGLSTSKDDGLPTFSGSVLRLEICGPKEDHLSVIDVPGIFRNTTPGLTTRNDKALVRDMVQGYMRNPRSIMLTVVPANVDIATQEIVEMAREFDPEGDRTLGVITKPDLVDKGGEGKVIDLVEGREMQMKLGWIIVRNLGQKELEEGDVDRNVLEDELLLQRPWDTVPRDKFGIKALRTHLQETVTANARRSFPSVRSEISKKLRECQDALQALGADRETPEQQASFLFGIVSSFQDITSHALGSNYSFRDEFDQEEILRLATRVVNRNEMFSDNMARWGHEYEFETEDSQELDEFGVNISIDKPAEGWLATRMLEDISGIEDILPQAVEVAQPFRNDIRSWIERQYRGSRGFEIGTFNSALLPTIMKKQSTKWTSIATGYIGDIITMVHGFILRALSLACADTSVCHNLLSMIMDRLLGKYQNAISQVQFLLVNECSSTLMTLNHNLNDTLEKWYRRSDPLSLVRFLTSHSRQKRTSSVIEEKAISGCSHGNVVRVEDLSPQKSISNTAHTVQDLHDILQSYYQVARKRFVDNVCMQAAGYYLVNGPETPMKLLSPSFVNSLTQDELEEIAGEEASLQRKRRQLVKKIKDLQVAKRILL
ncbi:uncharacterized protein LDX57_007718 [Aspergillus melleus]|uniref:uncharacterized protein n=1 Tax=Aspergillus melleus TaxID=138277 RepID=UPI001E8DA60C|nr:uncharacterized protein LDX57_007718 [Aspergillus melleus]KAH8430047.1 hypothetical protein LDX57_007718 [Aspergillus melleus]